MNSMSVSPVKPPMNPGNLSVPPTTATNLTKSSLPANNSFSALNLVPENKGTASASIPAVPTTPEKSVELTVKTPLITPTSNGTVSPRPDTGQSAIVSNVPNCSEKIESAENLSTTGATTKAENAVEELAKPKLDVEEKKEEKKLTSEPKGSSTDIKAVPSKDAIAQHVSAIETPASTDSTPVKKDDADEKKKEEKKVESRPLDISQVDSSTISPSKKEASVESTSTKKVQEEKAPANASTNKEEKEVKAKPESVPKKKAETEVTAEPTVAAENVAKTASPPKATKRKAKTPVESIAEEESADSRKSKRTRLPTQPYQSPIPELQLIAKLNTPVKTTPKTSNEKIIAFYKSEFLAVRNPEGSFYICQAFQNIHRSSTKIKIRWFTNLPQNIYTPDFYDTTEFDCILTSVTMNRVEKDRWKLPDQEQVRIENILKRALDVEKGVAEQPSITEEHPDGLDLSLYKDEAQLTKKKKKAAAPPKESSAPETKKTKKLKKKATKPSPPQQKAAASTPSSSSNAKKSPRVSSYVNRDSAETKSKVAEKPAPKKEKKDKKKKKSKSAKKQTTAAASKTDNVSSKTWEPSVKASNSSKVVLSLRKEDTSAKSNITTETKSTKRTSSVSLRASAAAAAATSPATTAAIPSPAKRRKEEPKSSPSSATPAASTEKTGKVRNAGSAVSAKINSAAMRTTKEKERKTATAVGQRKK